MVTTGTGFRRRALLAMVRQFGNPRGGVGRIVGWILAHRGSNRERNKWVVGLLEVRPTDRVLEVGFGPGLAIAHIARRALQGHVYGIDHSEVMVRQATKLNRAAVKANRVELVHAPVDRLPRFDEPLDTILSVNSLQFWAEPAERLGELRRLLRPGGRIALASQPRIPGANRDTTVRNARELEELLTQAGFAQIRIEFLELDPPVACVMGTNPG